MPRVLIVCDGDGDPKLCYSPSFIGSPEFVQAAGLLSGHGKPPMLVPTPQSQIDRFDMPGDDE